MLIHKPAGKVSSLSLVASVLILTTSCASDIEQAVVQLPEEVNFLTDGRTFSTRCAGYDRLGGRNQGIIEAQTLAKEEAVAANLSQVRSRFEELTLCREDKMTNECRKHLETLTQIVTDGFIQKAEKKIVDYPDNIVCVSLIGLVTLPDTVPFSEKTVVEKEFESPSNVISNMVFNEAQSITPTHNELLSTEKISKKNSKEVHLLINANSNEFKKNRIKSIPESIKEESAEKTHTSTPAAESLRESSYIAKNKGTVINNTISSTKKNLIINGNFSEHYSNGWDILNGKQKGIKKASRTSSGFKFSYKGKGSAEPQWALTQKIKIDPQKRFLFKSSFSTPSNVDVFPVVKLQFIDNSERVVIENVWTADKYYESDAKFLKSEIKLGFFQEITLDSKLFFTSYLSANDKRKIKSVRLVFDVSAPNEERCRLCEFNIQDSVIKYL